MHAKGAGVDDLALGAGFGFDEKSSVGQTATFLEPDHLAWFVVHHFDGLGPTQSVPRSGVHIDHTVRAHRHSDPVGHVPAKLPPRKSSPLARYHHKIIPRV